MPKAIKTLLIACLAMLLALVGRPVSAQAPIAWQQADGPYGGAIETLAINPNRPDHILAGTLNGIYKSTDGGLRWERLTQEPIACQPIRVLAIAPSQTRTIYAGGGQGLFRSLDDGASWVQVGEGLTGDYVSSLAIHPVQAEIVYAGVDGTLFKSIDGGGHWSLANQGLPTGNVWSLAIHPSDHNLIYAGTEAGIYVSADGGQSWYPTGRVVAPNDRVQTIAISQHTPLTLHIGTPSDLLRSLDGGANWQSLDLPDDILSSLPGEANRFLTILSDPLSEHTLYLNCGGRAIVKSQDDGNTWSVITQFSRNQRVSALVIHPQDPRRLFLGTSLGFMRSLDGGTTWEDSSAGILATEVLQLLDVPKVRDHLYAVTSRGIYRTTDQGKTWVDLNRGLPKDGIFLAMDPGAPQHLFALTQDGEIYRSLDGGSQWVEVRQPIIEGVVFDGLLVCRQQDKSQDTPILYLTIKERAGVWQSTDLGESWVLQKQGLPNDASANTLTPACVASGFIYAGVSRGVYRLPVQPDMTGSLTWQRVTLQPLKGRVVGIVRDPAREGYIYVITDSGAIYRGRADGSRWQFLASDALPTNLLVEALTLLPRRGRAPAVCVVTNGGLFCSLDDGKTWALSSVGCLQKAGVYCLAADDQAPGILYSGTTNGGVYRGRDTTPRFTPFVTWGAVALGIAALAIGAWFARRYLRRRQVAQEALFERNWEEWNQVIVDRLATQDQVTAPMLAAIPPQARLLAMRRYVDAHRDQDLVFREETMTIEPANPLKLKQLAENWLSLVSRLDRVDSAKPIATRITEQLCDLLGFAPIENRTFRSLFGYLVKAPAVRLNIPPYFPIIFILKRDVAEEDIRDVRDLMSVLNVTSFFALLVVVDTMPGQRERAKDLKRLARGGADDFIVLDYYDLRSLFLFKDAERRLINIILTQVDLTVVSPYVLSGPVPENMFFGRDYELKAILRTIRERSFAIVGGRKIGKTSVLNKVHRLVEQTSGLFSIHLDCQYVTNYQEFFDAFAQNAQITVESAVPDMLRRAMVRLRRQHGGNMIVLLLDEIDQLLSYDSQQQMRLFLVFRALSQEGLCRFVLCGERHMNKVLHDPGSPLFNFCNTIRLSYLTPRDARRMIQEPMAAMGITLADADVFLDRIVELSSCHPNLVQFICQMLLSRINDRSERILCLEDLDEVRGSGEFREFFLEVTWGNATVLERLITVLMAESPSFNIADVRQALQQRGCEAPNAAIEGALDGLMLFSILQRQNNTYSFEAHSFPAVLRESGLGEDFGEGLIERYRSETLAS